jgi:hypothetical protein
MSAKYPFTGMIVAAYAALLSLGIYARFWEYKQPCQEIRDAIVTDIGPHDDGESHLFSSGFRIRIEGEKRPIDFPSGNWDKTVKEGDLVDLTVREKLPWLWDEELAGLRIDDHK